MSMMNLHGEYECKLDDKGRLRMPTALLRHLGAEAPYKFFVNRGFEKCVMIYPEDVWKQKLENINSLNVYSKKDRKFIRYFFRGVQSVNTDASDRIRVSKPLLEYAGVAKEVVLFAYLDRIEMWDKKTYYELLDDEPEEFSDLAEEVLGLGVNGANG